MRGMTTGCERQPAISWHASRISVNPVAAIAEPCGQVRSGWGPGVFASLKSWCLYGVSAEDWPAEQRSTEAVINALAEREAGAQN